jgi:hypothetical protein
MWSRSYRAREAAILADSAQVDPKFTKHAATWLNAGYWADEPHPRRVRFELSMMKNMRHSAFVDPSGGSADSMTIARCGFVAERKGSSGGRFLASLIYNSVGMR